MGGREGRVGEEREERGGKGGERERKGGERKEKEGVEEKWNMYMYLQICTVYDYIIYTILSIM